MGGREESAQPGSVVESLLKSEVGISFGPKGKERERRTFQAEATKCERQQGGF